MADLYASRAPVRLNDGTADANNVSVMNSAPAGTEYALVVRPIMPTSTTVDTELPAAAALTSDGFASPTAPAVGGFLLGYNGASWDRIRTANTGRLQVDVVTGGGGTQYVGDAGATATPTGFMDMGLANAAAPAGVSADNDAVALWALRNGSLVVNLASGGTLFTIGQKANAASFPVTLSSDGYGSGAAAAMHVVLGTGAADYTLFGQAIGSAPFTRVTDGTTTVGVIAGTTALKSDLASVAGTATVTGGINGVQALAGPTAADAAIAAQPVTVGARASTAAPTDMTTDGDVVNLWASLKGALNVTLRDTSGGYVAPSGTQYVGDAAITATPTGTVSLGLANAAAPTDVSANNDAVAQWMLRNGSTVTNLASGGTLITIGAKTAAASIPVVLPTDGYGSGPTVPIHAILGTGAADYTLFGQTQAASPYTRLTDGTTVPGVIVATTALKTDMSSIAGTATVTAGVAGSLGVGGVVALDAAAASINPVLVGSYASAAAPSDVSADGDAVRLWALRNGAQVVNLASGGTLITIGQKAMASSIPVVIASDQGALPVAPPATGLPAGYNLIGLYGTSAAVAGGATQPAVVTNTPANTKPFYIKTVVVTASGQTKYQIKFGAAVLATGFNPQTSLTGEIVFDPPLTGTGDGATALTVDVTNREASAMDVYAGLRGYVLA